MHIRDLTDRIMRLNMVNSSCKTSLETLLYRQVLPPLYMYMYSIHIVTYVKYCINIHVHN